MCHFKEVDKLKEDKLEKKLQNCKVGPFCKVIFEIETDFSRKYSSRCSSVECDIAFAIVSVAAQLRDRTENLKIKKLTQCDLQYFRWLIHIIITPRIINNSTERPTYTTPEKFMNKLKKYLK